MRYVVSHYDESQATGLSVMVAALLSENLAKGGPAVQAARRIRRPIGLRNTEDGTVATVVFGRDQALVSDVLVSEAPVVVEASPEQLLALSQLMTRGLVRVGILTPDGRRILGSILGRRLKIRGLVAHPLSVFRLLAVLGSLP